MSLLGASHSVEARVSITGRQVYVCYFRVLGCTSSFPRSMPWVLSRSDMSSGDVNGFLEGSQSYVACWPRLWRSRVFHGGRDRGTLAWHANQFAPAAVECPACSTSWGQPPTWCDLRRCRERITKFHFEGVRRSIPSPQHGHQPQNWKRCVAEKFRAAAAPEFSLKGHQPQKWPPLDGMSVPSDKTSLTSLWNPHITENRQGTKGWLCFC